jgi:hypothetical protein
MNKKLILVFGAVIGGVLILLLAVAALLTISFTGLSSRDVLEEERHLLISADDLAMHTAIPGSRTLCESYLAKRNVDGSLELEYKYDTDEDPNAEEFLFLKSEAETSSTITLAKQSFADRITAYKMGASVVAGRKLEENRELFLLGEENFAAIVTQDGSAVGNIVVTRKGATVHSLILYGVHFNDRKTIESLFVASMR